MRVATFNIYWLGDNTKVERADEDIQRLARIVHGLNADVIAFQEVVKSAALDEVLAIANSLGDREYRVRDQDGRLLTSGKDGRMSVYVAFDEKRLELLGASAIHGGVGRLPCAAHMRGRASGFELLVVGVHLQSGYPEFDDEGDSLTRLNQCKHIARWIAGDEADDNEAFPRPPTDRIVILGDFNALYDASDAADASFHIFDPEGSANSLLPLREGAMSEWSWERPTINLGPPHSVPAERLLIDFVMLSPALVNGVTVPPTIHAFDAEESFSGFGVRLSDHRPVVVEIAQ